MTSLVSFSRRILPFLRNTPSTDMSTQQTQRDRESGR
jgi:hypothetical protein